MSPLMGQHSSNPGGSQGLLTALQSLKARADAGDAAARTTLQTIAAGGTTRGAAVPGWNEDINWGAADTGHGNTGGRAADRALASAVLSGNTNNISAIEANKAATHKDWTGGTLAKLAPVAAGLLLPGIGGIAAGALMGAGESATGVTNNSVLSGALQGGVGALGGQAIRGVGTSLLGGGAASAAPGAAAGGAATTPALAGALPGMASAAPSTGILSGIGSFAAKNPSLVAAGLGAGASIYGASQMGKADDAQAAIAQQAADDASAESQRRLNRVGFDEWKRRRTAPGSLPTA
jgi:hypothetical protein